MSTRLWQRLEAAGLAVVALTALLLAGHAWWWPLVLFLVFDLAALGYLAGPRTGAFCYNAVHSWLGPAAAVAVAMVLRAAGAASAPLEVVAGSWAFHIALDRVLGYGLKEVTSFSHTHLGRIGRPGK